MAYPMIAKMKPTVMGHHVVVSSITGTPKLSSCCMTSLLLRPLFRNHNLYRSSRHHHRVVRCSSSLSSSVLSLSLHPDTGSRDAYTKKDEEYLQLAVNCAQMGYGYTFPNPAVGCVLVLSSSSKCFTTDRSTTEEEDDDDDHDDDIIIGRGYHPRAGYPHAEIFALLEAARHVPCGIQAATSVLQHYYNYNNNNNNNKNRRENHPGGTLTTTATTTTKEQLYETVASLTKQYQGINGTRILFENCLQSYLLPNIDHDDDDDNNDVGTTTTTTTTTKKSMIITAYVTLEPCCHVGKRTPPCANALLLANGISRIVVGSRDPNPQVDGGGIQILQQQQPQQQHDRDDSHSHPTNPITVVDISQSYYTKPDTAPYNSNALITNFAKRITIPKPNYEMTMTGRIKRVLRTVAAQMLNNHTLSTVSWGNFSNIINNINDPTITFPSVVTSIDMDELIINTTTTNTTTVSTMTKNEMIDQAVNELEILPNWMEYLDGILWQKELVLLRLNKAISKRKGTTLLGNRIAQQLQACVVQTKGHTVLLYRPSGPEPIIDINKQLVGDHEDSIDDGNDDTDDNNN